MHNLLNEPQILAVRHFQGPCLILAGPGSGKTTVITQRTSNLIKEYGINPSNILVITFTKAAAEEMKQRFCKLMGAGSANVTFGTFHAVYFMVLKHAYHFQASNIMTEDKKYQLMREILGGYELEYDDEHEFIQNLLGEISTVKNNRTSLEKYESGLCEAEVFRKIFGEYKERMRRYRWIDFDDMLLYTCELFEQRKDILSAWQKKYQYILVDEFQDINQIQYDILRMLALPENNLFIVGDDDQSVYRFRGSKPQIMLNFEKDYPDTTKILLDVNYRCQKNIVDASLALIGCNTKRFEKKIRAWQKEQSEVRLLHFEQQKDQNFMIIQEIQNAVKEGAAFSDFAVLFRTNTQPGYLMEMMTEYNVPFKTKEKIPNLYEHWIAKDIFAYIAIAQGGRKRADLLKIMNRPKRYIGREALGQSEFSFEGIKAHYLGQPWIAERVKRLEYDIKMLCGMSPFAAINYIRRGIGYDDYLKEYAAVRHMKEEALFFVLDQLQNTAKGYKSYEQWKHHIRQYTEELKFQSGQRSENPNAVSLATLHSSKGLEFRSVYIVDVNEGIMPYKKAALEEALEEERRMFYVGMTRAKEHLTLCSVTNVNNKVMEPSRFLKEIKELQSSSFDISHPSD